MLDPAYSYKSPMSRFELQDEAAVGIVLGETKKKKKKKKKRSLK